MPASNRDFKMKLYFKLFNVKYLTLNKHVSCDGTHRRIPCSLELSRLYKLIREYYFGQYIYATIAGKVLRHHLTIFQFAKIVIKLLVLNCRLFFSLSGHQIELLYKNRNFDSFVLCICKSSDICR